MLRIHHLYRCGYVKIERTVELVARIVGFGNWYLAFVGFVANIKMLDVVSKVHPPTSREG